MGFSELLVLALLALLITGPKELPKMLRTLGQWAGQMRRMASDLRSQSGIDDVLRAEGLSESIVELRKLARGELDSIQRSVEDKKHDHTPDVVEVVRDREYPQNGCDAYNAIPDTAIIYSETFPRSQFASEALYVMGDETMALPDPPKPVDATDETATVEPTEPYANEPYMGGGFPPVRQPSGPPVNLGELLDEATKAVTPISDPALVSANKTDDSSCA